MLKDKYDKITQEIIGYAAVGASIIVLFMTR
jgi:hypothetical protein